MCNSCGGKSNHRATKRKTSKSKTDKCFENDDKNTEPPKCPNKKKRLPPKPKNCLTKIERIMMRIQPPIADRERYLHPEHMNCFLEESERIFIKKATYGLHPSKRPKACAEDKKDKTKKETNRDIKDRETKDEKTKEKEADEEKNTRSDAEKAKAEDSTKTEEDNDKLDREKTKRQVKTNKKKKKQRKRYARDIEDDSDSELSICSIDSEVCLVGSGLTKEDKKTIEENRRKVHPPPDNKDTTVEGGDNVPDATKQEENYAETEESRNKDE